MRFVNREWHTHTLTPDGEQMKLQYGLSDKAASLIDGLALAVRIDEVGKALGVTEGMSPATPGFRADLCEYVAELESRIADSHTENGGSP